MRSFAARALEVGLALAFSGSAAAADGEPIPGVDIELGKIPGGQAIRVPADALSRFSVRLAPGTYTVSTACRLASCPPHTISGSHAIKTVHIGSGAVIHEIVVGDRGPFIFSGQIAERSG